MACKIAFRYTKWKAHADEELKKGNPPVFSAEETYHNVSLWDGTLHENYFRFSKIEITSIDHVKRKHLLTPGPLLFRRVIASAVISDAQQRKFTLYRELAQPYCHVADNSFRR